MAESLEVQLGAAERALEKSTDKVVRAALEAQIVSIRKKMTTKDKRTTRLNDGTVIKVGDPVYRVENHFFRREGGTRYGGSDAKQLLPQIKMSEVAGINANGEIAFKGNGRYYSNARMSYNGVAGYFGSERAAAAKAFREAHVMVKHAEREVATANKNLVFANEDVLQVVAWADKYGAAADATADDAE